MTSQALKGVAFSMVALVGATAGRSQSPLLPLGSQIARAAAKQVGVTVLYDPTYRRLSFPGGDVPLDRGVCTDVVIRAFRAVGVDLQQAVHKDMRAHFGEYPQLWDLREPDRNIDHRRVPNLMKFLERQGKRLPLGSRYQPGDVVAWRLPNGLHHVGIVALERSPDGHPLVIHNIGQGAQLEDVLFALTELGHTGGDIGHMSRSNRHSWIAHAAATWALIKGAWDHGCFGTTLQQGRVCPARTGHL